MVILFLFKCVSSWLSLLLGDRYKPVPVQGTCSSLLGSSHKISAPINNGSFTRELPGSSNSGNSGMMKHRDGPVQQRRHEISQGTPIERGTLKPR